MFVIGPDKKVKLTITYPQSTGRNFDEILRVIDSLQLTANHKVSTPVNWKQGEDVIIIPAVTDDEARERFPDGWKAVKPYLRFVPAAGLIILSLHRTRPSTGRGSRRLSARIPPATVAGEDPARIDGTPNARRPGLP